MFFTKILQMQSKGAAVLKFFLLLFVGVALSCVDSLEKEKLDLSEAVGADTTKMVQARASNHLVSFRSAGKRLKVQWFGCRVDKGKGAVLLVNLDSRAFTDRGTCADWAIQGFLAQGYNVMAVNRPGFGKSEPKQQDFAGPTSLDAAAAAMTYGAKKFPEFKSITGVWGYGSGAITASFAAKKIGNVDFLIVGGGIYDLEVFDSGVKDGPLKAKLASSMKPGDADFYEPRSIAWDSEGIAKKVRIYHAQDDIVVPPEQAKMFYDVLLSSQVDVQMETIQGIKHDIPATKHRYILKLMLGKL